MSSWLHRTKDKFIARMSPRDMERHYPEDAPFVGTDGNAVSNVNWIWKPDLSLLGGHRIKYAIKRPFPNDSISLMPAAARDGVDIAEVANIVQEERDTAKAQFREDRGQMALLRVMATRLSISEAALLAAIDAELDAS